MQRTAQANIRAMDAGLISRMAVENGAALASVYFPGAPVGRIVPGAVADLILVDYRPPTPIDAANVDQHVIDAFQAGMVTTTMVAGKLLMKDRKLMTLDEQQIIGRCRELAPRVWKRMAEGGAT